MGRHSCCYQQKLRKGLWSPEEDEKLFNHITKYGHGCWSSVPKLAGLQRCGKSCRLRWINYLRPDLKRGAFSVQEENLIIELHANLGNRWSQIAAQLPGRTDNEIKNLWNSCIKKKLRQRCIDPTTHKPLSETDTDTQPTDSKKASAVVPDMTRSSSSKDPVTPTKEIYLDCFLANNDGHATTAAITPDCIGCIPLPPLTYSAECRVSQSPPPLWLNQTCKLFNMNPEISCSIVASTIVPSPYASSDLSTPSGLKPAINLPSENSPAGIQYWEDGTSSNNSSNSGNNGSGIEFQGNSCLFDSDNGSIFQWLDSSSGKEARIHLEGEPEDLKWTEYINGSITTSTAMIMNQNQASSDDMKEESQFTVDMHGKDFHKITSIFEHI